MLLMANLLSAHKVLLTVRSSDDEHIPENDRFSKNGYKAVPPPITGNFLTPRADISFGCHMTGNKAYLSDYEDFNGGFVAFGSDPKGVVLRALRKDDVYSLDLKNIVPSGGITCLYANATANESKLWHRRLGHVNFKNINKLVKGHLVRGLPSKVFVNDLTYVACKKGKQHKASCKAKLERIIRKPLELLHMDLFGPVSVESINKKGTSIRYALTHNPTIYDSLVKQFWQTATVRTLANGTKQLIASIDSKEYTITEVSVRSKLQLADATGIHNLSDAEIYAGLATLGGYAGDFVPLLPAMLAGAAMDLGEGSAQPAEPHHTPVDPLPSTSLPPHQSPPHSPHQSPPHSPHQSPPHSPYQSPPHSPLQSPPHSPPHYSPPRSYEAPLPEGNTSGSAEDSMQLKELMDIVPKLVTRIETLETELQQTKTTYGKAVLTLVKRVKILEKALKRKTQKVRIQKMKEKSTDFVTPTKASGEAQEEDISPTILEAAKTLSKVASQGVSKINTGREEINIGSEEVSTGSTKVDSGTASKRVKGRKGPPNDATVAGKPVTISEASIRSDLLFDDADGIDSLNNQAIFDNIQLMGYEGDLNTLTFNKALFSPQWKFLFHTMNHCISSKSTSWDQIPTNIATAVICLATNQKYNFSKLIFGGMIRHLDATKKFVMYPRFLQIFLSNQLKDVPVPLDHFPVPTLTKKVLTFMVKKGKNFSGKVTPLFDSMLVQQTEDEGEASERPSDSQPIPSPPHPSEDQPQTQTDPSPRPSPSIAIPDSNPEGSGGNHGGQSSNDASLSGNDNGLTLQSVYDLYVSLCKHVAAQAKEIKDLKAQVKKLKKGVKPLITHHESWMKTRLARKTSLKKKGVHKEYVSKQGRKYVKTFKGEPSVHNDPAFDDLDDFVDVDDTLDYMETKDVQDEKRNEGSEKGNEGTDKGNEGIDKQDGGTDSTKVSTDRQGKGTADQNEGKSVTQTAPTPTPTTPTPITPTPIVFGDDETIAQVLLIMSQNKEKLKEKEKRVEIRNVEETERPRPTSTRSILTLRPLPKIDPKDKDKSNPLKVNSLLKTIRLSIHLVVYNKELAIPKQTATGKEISNPLMAGSLPKPTKPTQLDVDVAVLLRRHVADKDG
ncbi:putative ribonuclease H-like domain-containing protein [Tanacetum coccineum]